MKDEGGFTNGEALVIVESLLRLKNYNTTCYTLGADLTCAQDTCIPKCHLRKFNPKPTGTVQVIY